MGPDQALFALAGEDTIMGMEKKLQKQKLDAIGFTPAKIKAEIAKYKTALRERYTGRKEL